MGAPFQDGIYTRMCQVNWAAWEIVKSFHNREIVLGKVKEGASHGVRKEGICKVCKLYAWCAR